MALKLKSDTGGFERVEHVVRLDVCYHECDFLSWEGRIENNEWGEMVVYFEGERQTCVLGLGMKGVLVERSSSMPLRGEEGIEHMLDIMTVRSRSFADAVAPTKGQGIKE